VTGLSDLLQKVFDFILQAWPVGVIQPWENGLRVRMGRVHGLLLPGPYLVIPYIDEVYTKEVNAELFTTAMQTVDGVSFQFVGEFRIVDLAKFYRKLSDDPITSAVIAVRAAGGRAMAEGAWKGEGATEAMLKRVRLLASYKCRGYGLRIKWLEFDTVTDSPVLRVMTDEK
jgi:hypothetical protein